MSSKNFFDELKRRNVYKVAVAYTVVAWLLIQVATQVFPFFEIPNWAVRLVVLLLVLGFPAALVLSWAFEITPEGIKRAEDVDPNESITPHTGRKIVGLTIALGVVAAGLLAFQLLRQNRPAPGRTSVASCARQRRGQQPRAPWRSQQRVRGEGVAGDFAERVVNLRSRCAARVPRSA